MAWYSSLGVQIAVALGLGAIMGSGSQPPSSGQGGNVPATKTPVSPEQMYLALENAWPLVIGGSVSRQSLLVLLSQWSLETGNGASMIQFNVGNFKATDSYIAGGGAYTTFNTTEVINGVTQHLPQNFKAYGSLQDGVDDYLQAMHGRFAAAWPYVLNGDLNGFAQALKNQGYYTADETAYANGLKSRYASLDAQVS